MSTAARLPTPVSPNPARLWRRGVAAVRHWSQRLGVQPAGWLLLGLAVAALVLGGLLGWQELRLAAVVGLVVVAISAVFMIGRQTYRVELGMTEDHVVVGEPAQGRIAVANVAPRRLLPARIELPVGRRLAAIQLPGLAGGAEHVDTFAIPTERRAVIRVGPARTVRGDPFGLMGREVRWTEAVDVFVHPQTVLLPGRPGGFVRDLEGDPTRDLSNSDVAFHALREYTSGDDRRYVHWRSTARTGTLMVRQFEETRRSRVAVGLDVGVAAYADAEEFELAVSAAGSVALQTLREENALALLSSAGRLAAVSPRRTLDELSAVEWGPGGGAQAITRQLKFLEPHASVVVAVTGSSVTPAQARRLCSIYHASQRVLAVRADRALAEPTVVSVGPVSVLGIGALDHLPVALRRAGM